MAVRGICGFDLFVVGAYFNILQQDHAMGTGLDTPALFLIRRTTRSHGSNPKLRDYRPDDTDRQQRERWKDAHILTARNERAVAADVRRSPAPTGTLVGGGGPSWDNMCLWASVNEARYGDFFRPPPSLTFQRRTPGCIFLRLTFRRF